MTYRIVTALGIILGQAVVASAIVNGDFEGYQNASPSSNIAVKEANPASWVETGIGGHSVIGDAFGDFSALPGSDALNDVDPQIPYAAWLTEINQGIYQSFSTTSGVDYGVGFVFGQFAPEIIPRLNFSAYGGPGIGGSVLVNGFLDADADIFGDGNVTGGFVFGFRATSDVSTILFTLGENATSKGEGVGVDNVGVVVIPEPVPPTLLLQGLGVAVLAAVRRTRG